MPESISPLPSERCAQFASDERIITAGKLFSATRRLSKALDQHLIATTGLSLAIYEALVHLLRSTGSRLTMGELAGELALTTGGATRLVDRLIERNLVTRVHCPHDRRRLHIEVTGGGADALERATPHYLEALDCLLIDPVASFSLPNLNEAFERIAPEPFQPEVRSSTFSIQTSAT